MSKARSLTEMLASKNSPSVSSTEFSLISKNEEHNDPEMETQLPSSSTVLHHDSDILQMLAGSSYTTTQTFAPQSEPAQAEEGYDIIELYSTIAYLKKENQDLRKESEFVKRSTEAIMKDTAGKYEHQIERLRQENQRLREEAASAQKELEEAKQNLLQATADCEDLHKEREELMVSLSKLKERGSNSSDQRSENQSLKQENNRLKMEIARAKVDSDSSYHSEIQSLQQLLQGKEVEVSDLQQQFQVELEQMRSEINKAHEQVKQLKNETMDKTQQISKITTDFMKLDRQFIAAQSDNSLLKEKLQGAQFSDRDLQEARYRAQLLENEIFELRKQNHQLQIRPSSDHSNSNLHPQSYPPSLPHDLHTSSSSSTSSYSHHGATPHKPYHYSDLNANSNHFSNHQILPAPPQPKTQGAPKSLSALGINGNRLAEASVPPSSSSLLSVLQLKQENSHGFESSFPVNKRNASSTGGTPFATDMTSVSLMQGYDQLERELTHLMTEKSSLQEEGERLHQRGLKTLKDRTRLQQVEQRLSELSKDISHLRLRLSSKPG